MPDTNDGGHLLVINSIVSTTILQLYITADNDVYLRNYWYGNWTGWTLIFPNSWVTVNGANVSKYRFYIENSRIYLQDMSSPSSPTNLATWVLD